MTNGRAETLRILANAFDELEQLRCRLRDEERAAVVAWLREQVSSEQGAMAYLVMNWALAIERGEHRREEKA